MVSNEDIHLVLAYFHLQSRRPYCPHEIASRPTLRARFLKTARQILGDVPTTEIVLRLVSLRKACPWV